MASSFKQDQLAFHLAATESAVFSSENRREVISLIDLTSLNDGDTVESIAALCQKAVTPHGSVAALCVYPRFVQQVVAFLKGSRIPTATVVNFPGGSSPLAGILEEVKGSLDAGATEIDLVFPYAAWLRGEREDALSLVSRCKALCAEARLKVILESGIFPNLALLGEAAEEVILAGADFVKTSTGKLPQGASLEAAAIMLLAIKKTAPRLKRLVGFKASGGIREPQQAWRYLSLAKSILGPQWPTSQTFRLGASQLLDRLLS